MPDGKEGSGKTTAKKYDEKGSQLESIINFERDAL